MKKIKQISCIFFVNILVISVMFFSVYAQPTIPKNKIPTIFPVDVRNEIKKLYSSDPVDRGYAAYDLGEMGIKATPAIPFLIAMLYDDSSLEWRSTKGWSYTNTSPGEEAAKALEKIVGDARIVELLIAALKDEDPGVRSGAAETLGKIGKPAFKPLIAALKNENADVRGGAAHALETLGDTRAVEPLIAALKDEDSSVRRSAAEALGTLGDARAVEPLIAALEDENADVRGGAAHALGTLGDTRAVEPLIVAVEDENEDVRSGAAHALREITDWHLGSDQSSWRWREIWNSEKKERKRKLLKDIFGIVFCCLIILSIGAVLFFKGKKHKMRQ